MIYAIPIVVRMEMCVSQRNSKGARSITMYDIPENRLQQEPTQPLGPVGGSGQPISPSPYTPPAELYSPPSPPPDRYFSSPPQRPSRNWRWPNWPRRRVIRGATISVLVVMLLLAGWLGIRTYTFGSAISTQPPLSSQANWMSGSNRVNIVILGYGGPGHDGPYLTDSLLVMSYLPATGATALISVPRDLWVQVPPNSGQYAKLNTAFSYGVNHGGIVAGGDLAAQKVTEVLGMNVADWVSIDFGGFQRLVDTIGGVDINVPDTFNASESPTYRVEHRFVAGPTHMDGATSLLFARARYCTPFSEASDFARSARQQLLVAAIAHKLRSFGGLFSFPGVMDALQSSVKSNLSLLNLWQFFSNAHFSSAQRIGLSNQNVLVDGQVDGEDVLLPQNGNWNAIQQYVQQQLGNG
jgi:polyisoprenyl-teichoic acid--peptidoglycan teichoic acid transferase